MLLKSLKLKDFRQFKGEQTVVFADDPTQNVTIVMGDNGTGKTTLAQAFTWCLYGETTFKDKILLCKTKSLEMMPGHKTNVRAELTLISSSANKNIAKPISRINRSILWGNVCSKLCINRAVKLSL